MAKQLVEVAFADRAGVVETERVFESGAEAAAAVSQVAGAVGDARTLTQPDSDVRLRAVDVRPVEDTRVGLQVRAQGLVVACAGIAAVPRLAKVRIRGPRAVDPQDLAVALEVVEHRREVRQDADLVAGREARVGPHPDAVDAPHLSGPMPEDEVAVHESDGAAHQ